MMGIKKAAAAAANKVVKSSAGKAVAKIEVAVAKGVAAKIEEGNPRWDGLTQSVEDQGKKLTGESDSSH